MQGATPTLYGLIPGYTLGPTLSSNPNATDVVTVVYSDTTFYLNCYQATVSALGHVTFGPATAPVLGVVPTFPPTNCLPSGVATPQAVNDSLIGLTPGDLVLMTLNGTQVVGEVTAGTITTGTNAVGTTYIVPFANSDALNMNQTAAGATAGLNGAALNATGANPVRLLVITYYIDKTVTPARLMRQISGHTPTPVADGIVYMKFSYDLYNNTTNAPAVNQPNPGSGDANDTGFEWAKPHRHHQDQHSAHGDEQHAARHERLSGIGFGNFGKRARSDVQQQISNSSLATSDGDGEGVRQLKTKRWGARQWGATPWGATV